jgi:type II secretory pathway predicted ATPase ExeA
VLKLKWVLTEGKLGVLTGALGTGKTTLCEFLIASLKEESLATLDPSKQVVPVFIHGAAYKSTEGLLRAVILGLEMNANGDRASLFEILRRWPQEHRERLAIVIDDVPESGADVREMDEFLRVLVDIPGIAILINGEPSKMRHFLSAMPSLRDRVQVHAELKPMRFEELKELFKLRLKNSGCARCGRLLRPNALKALHKLSKGVPRRALKAASNALHYAAENGKRIDARAVKRANRRPLLKRVFFFIR